MVVVVQLTASVASCLTVGHHASLSPMECRLDSRQGIVRVQTPIKTYIEYNICANYYYLDLIRILKLLSLNQIKSSIKVTLK